MAYLDRDTLTCPNCGATAPLTWVVGKGPGSKGVAYYSTLATEDWDVVKVDRGARIMCKACGSEVASRAGKEP